MKVGSASSEPLCPHSPTPPELVPPPGYNCTGIFRRFACCWTTKQITTQDATRELLDLELSDEKSMEYLCQDQLPDSSFTIKDPLKRVEKAYRNGTLTSVHYQTMFGEQSYDELLLQKGARLVKLIMTDVYLDLFTQPHRKFSDFYNRLDSHLRVRASIWMQRDLINQELLELEHQMKTLLCLLENYNLELLSDGFKGQIQDELETYNDLFGKIGPAAIDLCDEQYRCVVVANGKLMKALQPVLQTREKLSVFEKALNRAKALADDNPIQKGIKLLVGTIKRVNTEVAHLQKEISLGRVQKNKRYFLVNLPIELLLSAYPYEQDHMETLVDPMFRSKEFISDIERGLAEIRFPNPSDQEARLRKYATVLFPAREDFQEDFEVAYVIHRMIHPVVFSYQGTEQELKDLEVSVSERLTEFFSTCPKDLLTRCLEKLEKVFLYKRAILQNPGNRSSYLMAHSSTR